MSDELTAETPSNVTQFPAQEAASAPTAEQPQAGAITPEEAQVIYAEHLKNANTHTLFTEIKHAFQNHGFFMVSAHQALEHVLLRDQGDHADAVSAWDRVKTALKEAGAKFDDEEAIISGWLKKSDPRPPIQVAPPAPQPVATEAPSEPPTTGFVESPASPETPVESAEPTAPEPANPPESPVVPDQVAS
jgi:hypothetical protein